MIPDRLAWFAMGTLFSALLFGWPWHHRFSRYEPRRRQFLPPQGDWLDEAFPLPLPDVMEVINHKLDCAIAAEMARRAVQRGQGNGGPTTEKPPIVAKPQPHGGRLLRPWE
jgi:hypothetical protein